MMAVVIALALAALVGGSCADEDAFLRTTAVGPAGSVESVYGILDRILPGERAHFTFHLSAAENAAETVDKVTLAGSDAAGFSVEASGGKVSITASGTNELAAGLGFYLREHCYCVIGWPRGGGSQISRPEGGWPDASFKKTRIVPWSYAMNVCTHSYSLVWYGWEEWETFIDWMALSGINNYLAETGQEEVSYKVLILLHFILEFPLVYALKW
jgi:alpha-N-acetylglucosaminidase